MKSIKSYLGDLLNKLRDVEREKSHPLIHKIHREHKISKRTLFYVKEYGKNSNVPKTIMKESIGILLIASVLSSLGGLALDNVGDAFVVIMPLVILLPALNDLIGNFGVVVSSRFSAMLHEGRTQKKLWKDEDLRKLFLQVILIGFITAIISGSAALIISQISGYEISTDIALKVMSVVVLNIILIVSILFFISVFAGLHFYRKGKDPNNFLIPITTAFADFGNMLVLSALIILLF